MVGSYVGMHYCYFVGWQDFSRRLDLYHQYDFKELKLSKDQFGLVNWHILHSWINNDTLELEIENLIKAIKNYQFHFL